MFFVLWFRLLFAAVLGSCHSISVGEIFEPFDEAAEPFLPCSPASPISKRHPTQYRILGLFGMMRFIGKGSTSDE
jgi:hypothetical protein